MRFLSGFLTQFCFAFCLTLHLLVPSQYLHLLQPLEIGQQQQQLPNSLYSIDIYGCSNNNNNSCVVSKLDGNIIDPEGDKQNPMGYLQQPQHLQVTQGVAHDQYGYPHTYPQYMAAGATLDASSDSGISNDPGLSPKSIALVSYLPTARSFSFDDVHFYSLLFLQIFHIMKFLC